MEDMQRIHWPGWNVVRLIGRGSFGAVYEIERDLLGRKERAALKHIVLPQNESDVKELLNDGYDEASISATFQSHLQSIVDEYALMRKLNGCSNVVSCDDVQYIERDHGIGWDIYIKMELVTPLTEALSSPIQEDTVLQAAKDLCHALILCQKHQIIHRDIKPQNIFVSDNGDYKLGDFGIAKTVEKTMGGTKTGTYKYMAPEVYHNQPYGHQADIYSLGLVLYWMLNKRRMPFLPLPPQILTAGIDEQARNRRLNGEPLPPPADGSEELKHIVLKACAYDRKERYGSAAEMLADLEALSFEKAASHTDTALIAAPAAPIMPVEPELDDKTEGAGFWGIPATVSTPETVSIPVSGENEAAPAALEPREDPAGIAAGQDSGIKTAVPAKQAADSEDDATVGAFGVLPQKKAKPSEAEELKKPVSAPAQATREQTAVRIIPSGPAAAAALSKKKKTPWLIPALLIAAVALAVILWKPWASRGETEGSATPVVLSSENPENADITEKKEIVFNGHRFERVERSMTWEDADAFAAEQGGYLAVITSAEEQQAMENLIADGTMEQYWLGGYRNGSSSFCWVTGEEFSYSNWDVFEPSNHRNNEKYIQIYRESNPAIQGSKAYKWNDAPNNNTIDGEEHFFSLDKVGLIVEYDEPDIPSEAVFTEENEVIHYFNVYEVDQSFTWDDAEAYCESLGGHLATLTSDAQNTAAYEAFAQKPHGSCVYFGLTDKSKEGTWTWVTGESFVFSNWQTGEPDGSVNENYAAFYGGVNYGCWIDADFKEQSKKAIICEWDVRK